MEEKVRRREKRRKGEREHGGRRTEHGGKLRRSETMRNRMQARHERSLRQGAAQCPKPRMGRDHELTLNIKQKEY